jgi:hypothetical protein
VLDVVLPLVARDLDRATILLRSLKLLEDLRRCWIVVRDDEHERVRSSLGEHGFPVGNRIVVMRESTVVPELSQYRRLYRLFGRTHDMSGWYIQQLVKMAMAQFVETPFYLTLDADVICLKPVKYSDLVRDGRGIARRTTEDIHPKWYRWAERVLKIPRSRFTHGVTPAVLSRDAMACLQRYLQGQVRRPLRFAGAVWRGTKIGRGDPWGGWRAHLIRSVPWTEYALYGTFLEAMGLYDLYHVDGGPEAIYSNSVWAGEAFETWEPRALLTKPGSYFVVFQSTTGIAPEVIWERVRPLIE